MKRRRIDDFRPYSAEEIAFLNRCKDIETPDVQSAIEEVAGRVGEVASRLEEITSRVDETENRLDEYDPLHQGKGANSVKLGPSSEAYGDSSVAFGHGTITIPDAMRSVALGPGSIAHSESSVAIGTDANSYNNNGIAIGTGAATSDWDDGGDGISIGSYTFARNRAIAIGLNAEANSPETIAIGADSGANSEHTIAIGTETTANAKNSVAVGYGAAANWQNSVAIGPNAEAAGISGIALGDGAQAINEAAIAIGSETTTAGGENIALGKGATALDERSVAIGSGAFVRGSNSVVIGPGATVNADNTIVLGTPEHTVIIPGDLEVLGGVKSAVSWIAPSDDVIAEVNKPIEAEWGISDSTGVTEKPLTLRNPGRYRIKGYISSGAGSKATLDILENNNPIVNPVITDTAENFSVDFTRDIGVNTTLIFRLTVTPTVAGGQYASGQVSQIRICGTETDIGDGVVAW